MKRSDSLEVKACCKIALSRNILEELLERSWLREVRTRPCWGRTRCRLGQGRHGESYPVPYSPLIPALLWRRTFLLQPRQTAVEMYMQEPGGVYRGGYRGGFLAASSQLQP